MYSVNSSVSVLGRVSTLKYFRVQVVWASPLICVSLFWIYKSFTENCKDPLSYATVLQRAQAFTLHSQYNLQGDVLFLYL